MRLYGHNENSLDISGQTCRASISLRGGRGRLDGRARHQGRVANPVSQPHQALSALGVNGVGVRPGKGSPLRYSFEQAARLAIAFLLADIGLDPLLSVQLIERHWEKACATVFDGLSRLTPGASMACF